MCAYVWIVVVVMMGAGGKRELESVMVCIKSGVDLLDHLKKHKQKPVETYLTNRCVCVCVDVYVWVCVRSVFLVSHPWSRSFLSSI